MKCIPHKRQNVSRAASAFGAVVFVAALGTGCVAVEETRSMDKTPLIDLPHGMKPLRPVADCLKVDRIRSYDPVSDTAMLVDAGPDRYLLHLQSGCSRLERSPQLSFSGGRGLLDRVCGDIGEYVRPIDAVGGNFPCRIEEVVPIDKETYERLRDGS